MSGLGIHNFRGYLVLALLLISAGYQPQQQEPGPAAPEEIITSIGESGLVVVA